MPAVDDPFSIAASLPGQVARLRQDIKDLASNNTQAASIAAAAATAAASSASASATAALNATVKAAVGHSTTSGYALTTSAAELTRATITVPAGYTQALVFGTASMTIVNQSNTNPDFIRGYIDINGSAAPVSGGQYVPVLFDVTVTASYSSLITGLTGGSTFYVRCVYYNEFGNTGAASTRNICNLDATVTFLH